MAREMILRCNLCSREIKNVAGKIYIAPAVPGRSISYMSAYSASGDLCTDCLKGLSEKLQRRKPRVNGNADKSRKRTTKGR